jgi:hypothetical protein
MHGHYTCSIDVTREFQVQKLVTYFLWKQVWSQQVWAEVS